jgi:hypothetical protein
MPPRTAPSRPLSLGLGWSVAIGRRVGALTLSLEHAEKDPLCIEIEMTEAGPIVRTRANAIHIEAAEDIVARCKRFDLEASDSVSIRASEIVQSATGTLATRAKDIEMTATTGDIRLQANDDVQLLGEQVLLNCEREQPVPPWVPLGPAEKALLPRQDTFGNAELLEPGRSE